MSFESALQDISTVWAACVPVESCDEWRIMEVGEPFMAGDEKRTLFKGATPWAVIPPQWATTKQTLPSNWKDLMQARRRIRLQSPGWRYVDIGETLVKGDQWMADEAGERWSGSGDWASEDRKVYGSTPKQAKLVYRRRIETTNK